MARRLLDVYGGAEGGRSLSGAKASNMTNRDLFNMYDELEETGDTVALRTGRNYLTSGSGSGGIAYDAIGAEQSASNFGEGTSFRQSILNYGAKKREIAATRRAGYTGTSSVLGGSAL